MDWLAPVLKAKYPAVAAKTEFVVADVYEYMKKDVAAQVNGKTKYLLDIWDAFGGCDRQFAEWKKRLGPARVWGWGDVEY